MRTGSHEETSRGWMKAGQLMSQRFINGILSLFLVACFPLACANTASEGQHIDLVVRQPEDVKQLKTLEDSLVATPEKAALHPEYQVLDNVSVPFALEYRIGSEDVVEVVYHIRYEKTPEEYRLEVQDKISVTFPFHPQFSTTVLVRTDGKISLPLL